MHGLGNDYIYVNCFKEEVGDPSKVARFVSDRHFGIGSDGLVLIMPSNIADFRMRMFNSDGSEAEMCGNGIRCFDKYCYENGIVSKNEFNVETLSGIKHAWLTLKNNEVAAVKVDMGQPNWERSSLPMKGKSTCIDCDLDVEGEKLKVTCLSMGNPHCVIFVDCIDCYPVQEVGYKIENHKAFPKRTNVGFAEVLNQKEMNLRVWERGCGETLACGTGTCAAAAAANKLGKVGSRVTVHVLGGNLKVEIGKTILLSGAAEKVYEATLFKEP
jgi:diaminopimelate epimerase